MVGKCNIMDGKNADGRINNRNNQHNSNNKRTSAISNLSYNTTRSGVKVSVR